MFASADAWRSWLEEHYATEREAWVGFFRAHVSEPGISYEEAVEVALCFGWIDGIVRRVDDRRYMHRFSPRQARSPWSRVNVEKVRRLVREGRMHPAGLAAFERRREDRTGAYSYEDRPKDLDQDSRRRFQAHPVAWKFFQAQPPGYRRTVAHWVLSARRPSTRSRRLEIVLQASQKGERIDLLSPARATRPSSSPEGPAPELRKRRRGGSPDMV